MTPSELKTLANPIIPAERMAEISRLTDELTLEQAKEVCGQFTVDAWVGGWKAIAFQGGPGSSICLYGRDRVSCIAAVSDLYARGKVPMNATPASYYFADAIVYRLSALRVRANQGATDE